MTPRERVLTTINHKEPDKVPVDCGAMRSTGIMGVAYNKLKKYLGIKEGETKIYDMVQQLAIPEQWYLDRYQIDVIDLARSFADNPNDWVNWKLPDGSDAKVPAWLHIEKRNSSYVCVNEEGEVLAEMPSSSYYFDQKLWPLMGTHKKNFDDLEEILNHQMWAYMADPLWKNFGQPDFYERLREKAKKLYEETDYAIMIGFGGNLFETGQFLYRTDEFLVNLITERKEMEKMLDKLVEIYLSRLEPLLKAISPYVQIIQMGDDLGTQSGPMISPKLYREIFYPRHKKIYQYVKKNSNMYVFLHSCGAVSEFIPDLIEAGVDILNPVQISAEGMQPERLKREFGKDIVFWGGGVDTQHTLFRGTPKQVKDEVKRNTEIFMKDGGFVFNQVHNILAEVPPENIVAMYEAINEMQY
ncbi:methyltransferase [Candidatus Aerophobetes bacterium]|uniref:Methyltransferase n=1 Tax=Aerophobetes bacterium TaxID=2030807 RepID=A0A662DHB3_UNCAE|nr:MAG: methyltransferase [Candidatus Aerophobetes bacterium]